MAYKAKKTEHSGAKHGNGAYWGPKADAKKESNRIRRVGSAAELRAQFEDACVRDRDLDREVSADWSSVDA
jgi:hypothetical protein